MTTLKAHICYQTIFSLLLFAEKVTKSRRKTNTSRFPVGSLM